MSLQPRGDTRPVFRLGLAASYWPGEHAIRRALDEGVNYIFCYGFDFQMIRVLRSLNADRREKLFIATGAYNLLLGRQNMRRTLEKRLRQFRTGYLDAFLYLGVLKPGHFPARAQDELGEIRADPRVRSTGISCHDRKFAGQVAAAGKVDLLMIRYNAAHRRAEQETFPHAAGVNLTAYTATCWTRLLRRPRHWQGVAPSAGECYRFQLTDPRIQVALTAPRSERELVDNLAAARKGPLDSDHLRLVKRFGDAVHAWGG